MAAKIPVTLDILGGIDDAIKNQLPKAMRNMQVAVSRNALQLKFQVTTDGTRMTLKQILDDSTLSAEKLSRALNDVNRQIRKRQEGGGFKGKGGRYTTGEQSLLEARAALEAKLSVQLKAEEIAAGNAAKKQQELAVAKDKVDKSNKKVKKSTKEVTEELERSDNKLASLVRNSLRLIALHAASSFIRNVREVTSEFEMQRVALAGIIQDTAQAETLFKQLKAAALQSPFEIKQLVTFTKQLSAYRIETDKLFDTTMKLADVSAGLGVDMNRLVLAYGQVRAASVLRGQELRQFTEAGIPLVELLADKFTKLNGRMVSTADVFELISKRAVPFSMIEEIFNDMTESGGIFYKMQEKQSETLYGQWQKLRDALSIMYDEMGNTSLVHKAMTTLMSDAMRLLQNWRKVSGVLKGVGVMLGAVEVASLFLPKMIKRTTLLRSAWEGLKNMSVGGWIGIVAGALSGLIGYIIAARKEAARLGKELASARATGDIQVDQMVRNFKRLADEAVNAAAGSAEQRDALKELQRTYGDIIPEEDMQIERLRDMKGSYEELTAAIEQKIQMQVHEQNVNQIQDTYGNRLGVAQKGLRDYLIKEEGLSREEAGRVISGILDAVKDGLLDMEDSYESMSGVLQQIIRDQVGMADAMRVASGIMQNAKPTFGRAYLSSIIKLSTELNDALEEENDYFNGLNNNLGVYSDRLKTIREDLRKAPDGFTLEQAGSFEFNQARWQQGVKLYKENLIRAFQEAGGPDISDAFLAPDTIDFEKIVDKISQGKGTLYLKNFVEAIQKDYLRLAPQDNTTRLITEAAMRFANQFGVAMTKMQGYLKQDGMAMDEYAKHVSEFVEKQALIVQTLEFEQREWRSGVSNYVRPTDEDIENERKELNALQALLEFVREFLKESKRGAEEDPWIILIKNRMKFMQDFQGGVEKMEKYLSHSDALENMQEIMRGRGKSLKIDTETLFGTPDELRAWYNTAIKSVEKEIKRLGGRSLAGLSISEILAKDFKGRKLQKLQELLKELWKSFTDFDTTQMQHDIEKSFRDLTEKLQRSEDAQNLFQDILDATNDRELATNLTVGIYGEDTAKDFKDRIQEELNTALESIDIEKRPEELISAIASQDFNTILKFADLFSEEWQKRIKELSRETQKFNGQIALNLVKDLKKVKSFGAEVIDIANETAENVAKVYEQAGLTESQRSALANDQIGAGADKITKARYEAFKNMPYYIELFADLDNASSSALSGMRQQLNTLRAQWNNLDPNNLKEIQARISELDKQLALRNPFSALARSIKEYQDVSEKTRREVDAEAVTKTNNAETLKDELEAAEAEYQHAVKINGIDSEQAKKAKEILETKRAEVDAASEEAAKAQDLSNRYREAAQHIEDAKDAMQEWVGYTDQLASSVKDLVSAFASDEDASFFGEQLDNSMKILSSTVSAGGSLAKIFTGAAQPQDYVNAVSSILGIISGIANLINASRIKKANDQIKVQQRILDNLAYSYERLEHAMESSLGSDYISLYTQQLANLERQQAAYERQARAERDKGKKADKDKIRDYEDAARDAKVAIEDMQGQLAEFFTGTDVTSAAKDFASAWIDAYKEFGSTTDAMKEKFQDMIESMITRSLAAKVMQSILDPLFKEIDDMAKSDSELTASEIASIARKAPEYYAQINAAMTNLMTQLGAAGYNVRQQVGSFSGIARDIAGASEESITGLAAGINTQNFYMQHIDQNVALILSVLTGGASSAGASATGEAVDPYKDQMLLYASRIPTIDENIASLLAEVRKVIKPNGTPASHYVATNL